MEWNSNYNMAVAWCIVIVGKPYVVKWRNKAHSAAMRHMKEGRLKWLVTHEFRLRKRHTHQS